MARDAPAQLDAERAALAEQQAAVAAAEAKAARKAQELQLAESNTRKMQELLEKRELQYNIDLGLMRKAEAEVGLSGGDVTWALRCWVCGARLGMAPWQASREERAAEQPNGFAELGTSCKAVVAPRRMPAQLKAGQEVVAERERALAAAQRAQEAAEAEARAEERTRVAELSRREVDVEGAEAQLAVLKDLVEAAQVCARAGGRGGDKSCERQEEPRAVDAAQRAVRAVVVHAKHAARQLG
jgi:hypothetical protein